MRSRVVAAMICVATVCFGPTARAGDDSPQPAVGSKVKVFVIAPEESDQAFMCESGRVQSIMATAIAEHRIVSIVFLDQSRNELPDGAWNAAYGFRLAHRQNIKVEAAMICGN